MRIAYLTADFGVPVLGTKGASAHVRGLVEALRSEGHDLFVLAANIGEDADPSFPLRQVPFGSTLIELYDALQNESICAGTRLAKDLRNLLYASNLELQGRLMLEEFGPDLIYERHCLFSTAGRELSRYFDVPLILELNAPLLFEQQKMRGVSLPLVAHTAERLVLTAADHVVAVSQALRTYATDLGVASDRVSVIPNGVDPDVFGPVVGFVGSMKPWHGVETLLQTLQLLGGVDSPFRLLLVGSGPMFPELEEQSRRLGLAAAVHMTGAVPHHTVPDLLRAMDVTVVTYAADADEYFSPVKLFEYMAMALPVVAARVGQVCDVIDTGRTGWLYAPADAGELARLIGMLESDRDLCRTVGAAARERVMNEYTWRHNARRVVGIAEDLIGTRTPGGPTETRDLSLDAANLTLAERQR
ncbi:MAG: glycosyltransferase family 1 protein [Acidobacteria bacterium]|nr:MAG: glycosyltransferase family 1 protein [Acidobacteriota bacterium]